MSRATPVTRTTDSLLGEMASERSHFDRLADHARAQDAVIADLLAACQSALASTLADWPDALDGSQQSPRTPGRVRDLKAQLRAARARDERSMTMIFEQWKRRPVYVAQCRTWKRALELVGIAPPAPDQGIALPGDHILTTFHALPGHRDAYAQVLRNQVALSIRMDRYRKRATGGAS